MVGNHLFDKNLYVTVTGRAFPDSPRGSKTFNPLLKFLDPPLIKCKQNIKPNISIDAILHQLRYCNNIFEVIQSIKEWTDLLFHQVIIQ